MPKFELNGTQSPVFQKLDAFTQAYIEAAFFTSTGTEEHEIGEESTCSFEQLAPETLARMVIDCAQFKRRNEDLLIHENLTKPGDMLTQAGHDFLLTRNGHGAGFWDGDWLEPAGSLLTNASKRFSEFSLYRGKDGLIHHD